MLLGIAQIRQAKNSIPRRAVDIPDLGGEVLVRSLTMNEVGEIQSFQADAKNRPIDVTRRIVELACCNEDGTPMFVGEDVKLIHGLPWKAVETLSEAALDLSGMRRAAERED